MAKTHYVNNAEFLQALIEYKKSVKEAASKQLPKPILPDYIGECFLKIANHLSYKPNFLNYPFREDMVGDGIENCLLYVDNFNPDVSRNPFAYFTQIMWYAFLRRIFKEKKQLAIKYACIQNSNEFMEYVNQDHDETHYDNTYITFLRKNMRDITAEFEEKKRNKKTAKKKGANLEKFFEGEPEVTEVPAPVKVFRCRKKGGAVTATGRIVWAC